MKLPGHERTQKFVIIVLLAICTLTAYLPVLHSGFVNCDDPGYVTKNAVVQGGISLRFLRWAFTTEALSNWHPLTWISHALDCTMFGLNPGFHHAVNLLLHIINTILLYLLFVRLTGRRWGSLFIAAVFALHPLHVESVAWISERKDVLSTLFWLLATGAFVRYTGTSERRWYGLSLLYFVLGLLAKPMLVTLPFVLILLEYWPLQRLRFSATSREQSKGKNEFTLARSLKEKIPFFILSGCSSLVTFLVQRSAGSVAPSTLLPLQIRVGNAILSYIRYLYKTFIPVDLAVFYPYNARGDPLWEVGAALAVLLVIMIVAWRVRAKQPYVLVGWLWFIGTLIPVIGIVQVGGQSMADRYMYFPLIGLSIMVAWGVPELLRLWKGRTPLIVSVAVLAVISLGAATYRQCKFWKDGITLFTHAISVTTNNHFALNNLGSVLADSGRHAEALTYLQKALQLLPDQIAIRINIARSLAALGRLEDAMVQYRWMETRIPRDPELHKRMGDILLENGRADEAVKEYSQAVELDSTNGSLRRKLAGAYLEEGLPEAARDQCTIALQLDTVDPAIHRILGIIEMDAGERGSAMHEFNAALAADSNDADSYNFRGLLFERRGEIDNAVADYRHALFHNPDHWNAHYNLGTLLAQKNDLQEAEVHLRRAAELNPGSPDVRVNLGRLFMMRNDPQEAESQFLEALRTDSAHTKAHYNLGLLLAEEGRFQQAESQLLLALRFDPRYEPAQIALAKLRTKRTP